MIEERVRPALKKNQLTQDDLLHLLRDLEEFGHQHVFLFRWKSGRRSLPDDRGVREWLAQIDAADLSVSPRIIEYPAEPAVADVRRSWQNNDQVITIKIIETRVHTTFLGEEERSNNRFVRLYQRELIRAVDVVNIHSEGFLEIRVYSHRSGERNYKDDVDALWAMLAGIIDPTRYDTLSLAKAKQTLWEKRAQLDGRIRFSDSSLLNTKGTRMSCSAGGSQRSLFDDRSADEGLRTFHEDGNAYFDSHNTWWLKQTNGPPSQDVHVLLSGDANEIAVTRHCSPEDYDHVLSDILRLNR